MLEFFFLADLLQVLKCEVCRKIGRKFKYQGGKISYAISL